MNTVKFNKGIVKMVAHRGVSGLECENTAAAFIAAGNRSYFGIETDTHTTSDGNFIVIHDANTERVSGISKNVEELPLEALDDVRLFDREAGVTRRDLAIPTLEEYLRICKRYEKVAVLELKTQGDEEMLSGIAKIVSDVGHSDMTVYISFSKTNVILMRKLCPEAKIQFLTSKWEDSLLDWLKENKLDLDIHHAALTKELVDLIHENGMEINCWTVNEAERGEELAAMGVDYITTNILE